MPTISKVLPFDERNDRDFEELTQRLRKGLDLIRRNRSLRATQNTLARLAGCSRRTLHIRKWPIDELKKIKADRRPTPKSESVEKTKRRRDSTSEEQLIQQIRNYQKENGRLFDLQQCFEQEQSTWHLIRKRLEEDLASAIEKIAELEKELQLAGRAGSASLKLVASGTSALK